MCVTCRTGVVCAGGGGGGCICVKEGIQEQKGKQKACEKETAKGQKKQKNRTYRHYFFNLLVSFFGHIRLMIASGVKL